MYYVSKTLAEQAAMQFAKENRMEVVSILPVIVAGPWLTTGVPASVDVTLSLITGNRNLHVILKWIGPSFVHIEDLCRAHLFLMEEALVFDGRSCRRYICSAHSTTLSELSDFICKRCPEYKIPFQLGNAESDYIFSCIMSSKKLLDLGFTYRYDMGDIIDQTLQQFNNLGIQIQ